MSPSRPPCQPAAVPAVRCPPLGRQARPLFLLLCRPSASTACAARLPAMASRQLRTVLTGGGFFEGPRWRDGTWWVSDFYRHQVSTVSPDGRETVVVEVENQPSGLGWLPDGSLVIVSMKDQRVLRFADGGLSTLAELAPYCGGHLNDLVVDRAGRVFVGDFGFDLMAGGDAATTTL